MERGGGGERVRKKGEEMLNSWLLYAMETGIGSHVIYAITYQGTDCFQVML